MLKFKKVIVWGYPLYTHTHSFIHHGWYKAFKELGYETYWFSDDNFPEFFDYNNAIFITEGYADKNIPLVKSSVYFVHIAKDPLKYLEVGCRLIDIRFNLKKTRDFSYDYTRPDEKLVKLDDFCLYEKKAGDSALVEKYRKGISGYEAVYMFWATDFLPREIDLTSAFVDRTDTVHHVGSFWSANREELLELEKALARRGVKFDVRDPWKKITTNEEAVELVRKSYIAPDIRGSGATCDEASAEESNHLTNGYIPCRVFKNISYGQLGMTNSPSVHDLMGDYVIFSRNIEELVDKAEPHRKNYGRIIEAMSYVKSNHTFINRIEAILKVIQ
jgi:hypothetical protein